MALRLLQTYKGYLDGAESYWCHGGCGPHGAVDWWDSQGRSNATLPLNPVFNETCHNGTDTCPVAQYSATLIGDRAVELIHATPGDPQQRPMFMCAVLLLQDFLARPLELECRCPCPTPLPCSAIDCLCCCVEQPVFSGT